jgi:arsenite methyltransferase
VSEPTIAGSTAPEILKACCAAVYQHDLVALVLGETYHPGGLELTRRLARSLELRAGQRVLDVACGPGATACLLAAEFGVEVDALDLAEPNLERGRRAAAGRSLDGRVRFQPGDAERLPFRDAVFDAVMCECAVCTFPDKAAAAAEFARVLRPGGCAGITDVTLDRGRLDPDLATLAGYVACIAGARPLTEYASLFAAAGLSVVVSERHDDALAGMVDQIEARLRALAMLGTPGVAIDLEAVLRHTATAARAVADGVAGYHLLVARKAGP